MILRGINKLNHLWVIWCALKLVQVIMISGILEKISPNSADLTQARAVRAVPGTKKQCSSVTSFLFFSTAGCSSPRGWRRATTHHVGQLTRPPGVQHRVRRDRANFVSRAKMPSKKVRRARLPRDPRRFRPPTALLVGHTWSATPSSVSWGRQSKLHLLRVLFLSKRCG
jgi:hypothetical protein